MLDRAAWTGPGNINLFSRPLVKNPDGSTSTVYSMSFEEDGQETLIPRVERQGKGVLQEPEAVSQYDKTGEHLGRFSSVPEANAYAEQLHTDFETGNYTPPLASSRRSADPAQLQKVLTFLLSRGNK